MADPTEFQLKLDLGTSASDAKKVAEWIESMGDEAQQAAPKVDKVEESVKKVDKSSGKLGSTVLSASYAFQDFTSVLSGGGGFARALGSIQNNIPQILAGLGLGAGLTGVVSVAAVAVGVLVDNFAKLHAAWASGPTEQEIERLKKLAEAADKAREAVQKQIDALEKQRNADREGGEIASAAIGEYGGERATSQAVQRQMLTESPEVAAARANVSRFAEGAASTRSERDRLGALGVPTTGFDQQIAAYEKAADDARRALKTAEDDVRARAQTLVVEATKGDREAIAELAKRLPGGSFGQATPEGRQAEKDFVEADAVSAERLHENNARRRAEASRIDDLNAAGRENESATWRAQQASDAKDLAKLTSGLDKVTAAGDSILAKNQADLDDPQAEARRAGIRQRSELGYEFKQRLNAGGYNPTSSDVSEAALSIQSDLEQGVGQDEAMANAFNRLLSKVQTVIEVQNRNAMRARAFDAAVNNLPPVIDPY